MTPFEIIILGIIYLICYGFTIEWFAKEEDNVWFRLLASIMCLVFAFYTPLIIGGIIYEKLKDTEQNTKPKFEMQSYIDKYMKYIDNIDKHIKSIHTERRGDKFYGTLTDKEGRTFEFSKDVVDIEKHFSNTHGSLHEDADIRATMLMNCFKRVFIGLYESNVLPYRH